MRPLTCTSRTLGAALLACVLACARSIAQEPAHGMPDPDGRVKFFDYGDVELMGGPLAEQATLAREFVLAIPNDDLLHGFRTRAGLPAPGKPMGGWYDPDNFAGAHPFGQFISALSRFYANTGDERFREKVAHLVGRFRETIAPDGFFYSSDKARKDWACYIYDKNCTGMRDAYTLAGCAEALDVLRTMTDWAQKNLPRRNDEWYTLPENLYRCHELTGEERYLALAREYDYQPGYFDVFARGGDGFLTNRHAYSHVNALSSAARAFVVTRERAYFDAPANAWELLTRTQSYASAGWGPNERFVKAGVGNGPGGLAHSLRTGHNHFETVCGTYATVNLDRSLFSFTGDPKYIDHMERVILNGMLAALPPKPDGNAFYYSDYSPGATKGYFRERWSCCAGTYGLNGADYPIDIYARDGKGPMVLLFVPSRLSFEFRDAKVEIRQATDFPEAFATALRITCDAPVEFALRVRVPAWADGTPAVTVNGEPVADRGAPGAFVSVQRRWSSGDLVDVKFGARLRFDPIDPEVPELGALMYGPLMLVALADGEVAVQGPQAGPEAWAAPVDAWPLALPVPPPDRGAVPFLPFYTVRAERYTTYVTVK